jgi:hypothetical protein
VESDSRSKAKVRESLVDGAQSSYESTSSHAADLSESDWSIITRTNCLLSGHKMVVYQKKMNDGKTTKEMRVERSPYSGR